MLGGSGLAVGKAEGDGDGLGVAFFPPKRPACALGVVDATPIAQPAKTNAISANCFKRPVL